MIRFNISLSLVAGITCLIFSARMEAQTITSFNPELGQVGQQVNITGTGFWNGGSDIVNQVWFGDILLLPHVPGTTAGFYVSSATLIIAFVPPGAVDAPISVKRSAGERVYSLTNFNVIGPEPYITSFTPHLGPGGTVITIDGVQFLNNVTAVKINGTNVAEAHFLSTTRISATAQADVTTGPITVVGFGTGSNTTTDLFYVPPVIFGFSPPSGRAGDALTIRGINFTNATQVLIGNVSAPVFNVNGTTQIVATVPSGAVSGKVTVWTPGGQYQTTTNFALLPSISGFSPTFGTTNTTVTISGANLNVPPIGVKFNGVSATVISSNFNQIVALAPASSSGPIAVTTGEGGATSASVFYYPPRIDSFAPGFGGEGTVVNISGSSFTNATAVRFNLTPALTFTVNNNGAIKATAPNNVSTGPLTVVAPGGEAVSAGIFYAPAKFTGFLPSSGSVGTDVILFGDNFEGASAVAFNGTPASILSNTGDQIGTKVPTSASTGLISITTPAGTVFSASPFVVPTFSDLRVHTFTNLPNPVVVGGNLTLTLVPTNSGPDIASNVIAAVTYPAGVLVKSASTPKGTVSTNSSLVTFNIGSMAKSEALTLTVVLTPQSSGSITNTATLFTTTTDPNSTNNTASRVTMVVPSPELSIGPVAGNQVRVSWPSSFSNFLLQSTLGLPNNPAWANVPGTPVIEGNERVVTQPSTGAAKYYRLKQ